MSALDLDQQALVARAVAALREQGWPAGRALRLVADRLPAGTARDAIAGLATDLEAGRVPAASDDPFLTLLARGDQAGPESLRDAVLGIEAEREVRRAWTRTIVAPAALVAVALALMTFGAFVVLGTFEDLYRTSGSLPTATVFSLGLGRAFRWVGPVLTLLVLAFVLWFPPRRSPGAGGLRAAAALRWWAGAGRPLEELPQHGLDRYQRALLRTSVDPATGAREVARELEQGARRWRERGRVFGPILGTLVLLVVVSQLVLPVLLALYLPVFTLAGSIK